MYNNIFNRFSDNSRIWIYGFKNALTNADKELVHKKLNHFINTWKSHGKDVDGDYSILYNQFVIIATNYNVISGCSIDSSVQTFRDLKNNHNIDALDFNIIFYQDRGKIEAISRTNFSIAAAQGNIDQNIYVFDTTISTLGQLRSRKFIKPIKESWHKVLLRQVA